MKKLRSGNCADCGQYRKSLHEHHVVPKSQGGSDDLDNKVLLCANCHQDRHLAPGMEPWAAMFSPENKAKSIETHRILNQNPEYREKVRVKRSSSMKKAWQSQDWTKRNETLRQTRKQMYAEGKIKFIPLEERVKILADNREKAIQVRKKNAEDRQLLRQLLTPKTVTL